MLKTALIGLDNLRDISFECCLSRTNGLPTVLGYVGKSNWFGLINLLTLSCQC